MDATRCNDDHVKHAGNLSSAAAADAGPVLDDEATVTEIAAQQDFAAQRYGRAFAEDLETEDLYRDEISRYPNARTVPGARTKLASIVSQEHVYRNRG